MTLHNEQTRPNFVLHGTNIDNRPSTLQIGISCRDVYIGNIVVRGGGDDAVALKNDCSCGAILDSSNILVENSTIGSNGCNALQFGSETAGNLHNITWRNIQVTSAGKAGSIPLR